MSTRTPSQGTRRPSDSLKKAKPTNFVYSGPPHSQSSSTLHSNVNIAIPQLQQFKLEIDSEIAKCLDTLDRKGIKYLKETMKSQLFSQTTSVVEEPHVSTYQPPQQKAELKPKSDYKIPSKPPPKVSSSTKQYQKISAHKALKAQKNTPKTDPYHVPIIPNSKLPKHEMAATATQIQSEMDKGYLDEEIVEEEIYEEVEAAPPRTNNRIPEEKPHSFHQHEEPTPYNVVSNPFKTKSKASSKKIESESEITQSNYPDSNMQLTVRNLLARISKLPESMKSQLYKIIDSMEDNPNVANSEILLRFASLPSSVSRNYDQSVEGTNQSLPNILVKPRNTCQDTGISPEDPPYPEEPSIQEVTQQPPNKPYAVLADATVQTSPSYYQTKVLIPIYESVPLPKVTSIGSPFRSSSAYLKKKGQKEDKASVITTVKNKQESNLNPSTTNLIDGHEHKIPSKAAEDNKKDISNVVPAPQEKLEKTLFIQHREAERNYSKKILPPYNLVQKDEFYLVAVKSTVQMKLVKMNKRKTLTIYILSNRGHPSLVGLTAMIVYSVDGNPIIPDKSTLSNPKTAILFNGTYHTIDEGQMWLTTLNKATFEIELKDDRLLGLRVWNYNKSQIYSRKEVSEMAVAINETVRWQGSLLPGCYNEYQDYHTYILFIYNGKLPPLPKIENIVPVIVQPATKQPNWLDTQEPLSNYQEQALESLEAKNRQRNSSKNIVVVDQHPHFLNFPNSQYALGSDSLDTPARVEGRPYERSQYKKSSLPFKQEESSKIVLPTNRHLGPTISTKLPVDSYDIGSQGPIRSTLSDNKASGAAVPDYFDTLIAHFENQINVKSQPPKYTGALSKKSHPMQANLSAARQRGSLPDFDIQQKLDSRREEPYYQNSIGVSEKKEPISELKRQPYAKATSSGVKKQPVDPEIDDLINYINEIMDDYQDTRIPILPSGSCVSLILLQNWGSEESIGLNGVYFFDKEGKKVAPKSIYMEGSPSSLCHRALIREAYLTSDENLQWKTPKRKVTLTFLFGSALVYSMIRIWNFNGHRVHSNIGVQRCMIKVDTRTVFNGYIKQSISGDLPHQLQYTILFTYDSHILRKITSNDWLVAHRQKRRDYTELFRSTMSGFLRPSTGNTSKPEPSMAEVQQLEVKIPKRWCQYYEVAHLPFGTQLRILLHSTWGDRHFVGLNGICLYDETGLEINQKAKMKIAASPSWVGCLPGYENDKRVVSNLLRPPYLTTSEKDIWLTPLESELSKVEYGQINVVSIDFANPQRLSCLNIYNYAKTNERGVRYVEVFMNDSLVYRGYLRQFDRLSPYTTINFTKYPAVLQKVGYCGYNEDNLGQDVGLVNEEAILLRRLVEAGSSEPRPLTGTGIYG